VLHSSPATAMQARMRCSSYSFLTWALDIGWVVRVMPRPRFTPGKGPPAPIGQEAGCASELVWAQTLEENISFIFVSFSGLEVNCHPDRSTGRWLQLFSNPAHHHASCWVYSGHLRSWYERHSATSTVGWMWPSDVPIRVHTEQNSCPIISGRIFL
jgi:hypothetical protein